MNNEPTQKQLFRRQISAEGCLGIGLAAFALGTMFLLFQSPAFSATQAEDGKGDAKRGLEVFEKRCTGCHSLDEDKEGPRLRGVYGKKAGILSTTFEYSAALKASKVTWDAPSLNQWMADPEKIIPKSDMFFRVPQARERTDVIAYLQTLSNKE
jgi:cytochrome c